MWCQAHAQWPFGGYFYAQDWALVIHMNEPTMARCYRCDALVALADASVCEIHDTPVLCHFCWTHHWMSHQDDNVEAWARCWSLVASVTWE